MSNVSLLHGTHGVARPFLGAPAPPSFDGLTIELGVATALLSPGGDPASWFISGEAVDSGRAMAQVFGNFELVGKSRTVGAPAREVLIYRPTSPVEADRMRALPPHRWIRVTVELWAATDHETLSLAPTTPGLVERLTDRRLPPGP